MPMVQALRMECYLLCILYYSIQVVNLQANLWQPPIKIACCSHTESMTSKNEPHHTLHHASIYVLTLKTLKKKLY
jgi:hypothetical protein